MNWGSGCDYAKKNTSFLPLPLVFIPVLLCLPNAATDDNEISSFLQLSIITLV